MSEANRIARGKVIGQDGLGTWLSSHIQVLRSICDVVCMLTREVTLMHSVDRILRGLLKVCRALNQENQPDLLSDFPTLLITGE